MHVPAIVAIGAPILAGCLAGWYWRLWRLCRWIIEETQ